MKLLKDLFLIQDNTRFGVSLAILSAAMLAINDVLVKFLLKGLPFYEIIFIRSLIVILGLICLKEIGSKDGGQKNDLKFGMFLRLLRTLFLALAGLLFFYSVLFIPIVLATALALSFPILTSFGAGIFLKEKLGREKVLYVLVGFIGSMMILEPFKAGMHLQNVLPFLAALMCGPLLSFYLVSTRYLSKKVSLINLTLEPQIGLLFISIMMLMITPELLLSFNNTTPEMNLFFADWKLPAPSDLFPLIILGLNGFFLFYLSIKSYHLAEASIIAPFEYFIIPFTMVLAFCLLGESPNSHQAFGAILVFGALFLIKKRID
jgi:drug/metabolite transporter (DMT)-like permease